MKSTSKTETLEQRCRRAQREYEKALHGSDERRKLNETRCHVFSYAIRERVSYRQLAKVVNVNVSTLGDLLKDYDTERPNPLTMPYPPR